MDKINERVSKRNLKLPALAILLAVLATGCGQNHESEKVEVVESNSVVYNPILDLQVKKIMEKNAEIERQEKEEAKQKTLKAAKIKAEAKAKTERKAKEKAIATAKAEVKVEAKKRVETSTHVGSGSWESYVLTHYTATCRGCSGFTRTEIDVRNTTEYHGYKVLSVDQRRIPLGSIVEIKDGDRTYKAIAIDTGGAIKGNKLDLLVGSNKEAVRLGKKNIKLRIVRRGWQDAKDKI